MLKKLRLRFVCVLMAIVTVTLCLMFGLVYHFTRAVSYTHLTLPTT